MRYAACKLQIIGTIPMKKRTQPLLALIVIGLIDTVIPFFPVLALVLIYVLLERPAWFLNWVQEIYRT